jgi:hypothetical protein
MKDLLDIGSLVAVVTNFINEFFNLWPHLVTGISAFLGMIWIGLGVIQRMRELGWLKGRTKRTRKDDDDIEL